MTDILKIHCSAWRRSSVGYLMPTAVPDTMSPGHSSVEGKQACPGRCTVYPNCDCYKARLPQKCSTCNYRSFLVLGVRAHLRRMVRTQGMVAGLQIDLQTCHHANLPIDLQQVHRPWSEKILQRHSPMMMDVMLHGTRQHERCFNTCNTNIDELLVLDAAHQLTGTGNQHW